MSFKTSRLRIFGLTACSAAVLCLAPNLSSETLRDALASAYDTHPQLKAERERVREIDETYVQARAQGRFTASGQGSAGLTRSSFRTQIPESRSVFGQITPSTIVTTKDTFAPRSFQITGQKPLYQGGRVRSLMGQAKYGILSAREKLRNAEQSILLTAATAYADVLQNQEALSIRRNNVRVLERQVEAATDRFDVGAGTRTDIAQADARLAGAQIGLSQAQAALSQSRASYLRAVGHIPQQLEPIPDYLLPQALDQAQEMAVTYNPQLEAARYAQDAAKFGIDVAKSAGRPTISLQTFTQVSNDQGGQILGQEALGISANITVPIMTGGLNASQIRAARAAENRAIFEMRNVENAVREQVATLWAQLQAAKDSLRASESQVRSAEIAFEGVQIEQQVGTRDVLDVLNSEQEVLDAKLTVAQANRAVDVLSFQLLSLIGAFDALSLELGVDAYDPKDNFEQVTSSGFLDPLYNAAQSFPLGQRDVSDPSKQPLMRINALPSAAGADASNAAGRDSREDAPVEAENIKP